ncbi:MAG: hypothetical protein ABR606_17185 [Vicinamibacterales bacterium]
MRSLRRIIAGVAMAAVAFGAARRVEVATDLLTRTLPLPEGRVLAVAVTIGAVHIVGEPRDDAVIDVVRHVPDPWLLARLPVVIDETPTRVEVRVIQGDGATDPGLRSDVTLRIPTGAHIDAVRILEGRLALEGLSGHVTAELQRGPIEARAVSGALRLETSIGHVTVREARLVEGGVLRLRAFNGDVRLSLAERPPHARIMALALNGTIRSAIPLRMKETWGPRWGEATLGRGEPVISIDVVTGRIDIESP